jgi:hypothetical protein
MYHVYLRDGKGRIMGRVTHPKTRESAKHDFSALVNHTEYDGFEIVAVLTEDKRPVAIHRFDAEPGSAQFWRDRLHELPFSLPH